MIWDYAKLLSPTVGEGEDITMSFEAGVRSTSQLIPGVVTTQLTGLHSQIAANQGCLGDRHKLVSFE